MRQFWLAKKRDKRVALKPFVNNGKVEFEIVENPDFDPSKGTIKRAVARCLVCGSSVDANTTRKLFQEGKASQRVVAVVLHHPKKRGKTYRIATEKDLEVFKEAEKYLEEKRAKLMEEWGTDPVPDEPLVRIPVTFGVINVWVYGMNSWGDLFNSRQKLALITFAEKVRLAYEKMVEGGYDEEYAKAVVSYLGLVISRMSDFETNLCRWHPQWEFTPNTFARQALPMSWDYTELNLFSPVLTGTFESMLRQIIRVLDEISEINNLSSIVIQTSAISLPYPDNYFDAVFTDPPYYDNVPYSYLSDFFYVWLKRAISDLYPDLFSTPLTPKSKEIVAYTQNRTWEEAKKYFETMLGKSFNEIHRVLKPNGIAVIVYAHKTTSGWETLINSLLDSGLVITATLPINTEMKARLRAKESAALASSIYIIARKMGREPTGWYNEVKEEIKSYLHEKLDQLWKEGVSGADFLVAGIGSAIEVFGKYEKVMDYEGNVVRADKLLNYVREVVTDYTVRKILHDGIASELSPLTCFYILYRWSYQSAKIPFDEARKLAQSLGVNLEREWDKGFIDKKKEYIDLLPPNERKIEEIKNDELIDVLHKVLLYWEKGEREKITEVLKETGYMKESFFRVAQAISECLNVDSKEKKLLDGFLTGKEKIMSEAKPKDTKLGEFME